MSHLKIKAMFPEVTAPKKLSEIKDKDEKRFRVEDAVRTMKRAGEIKREIAAIKLDKPLLEATKVVLGQEIADAKKAMTS